MLSDRKSLKVQLNRARRARDILREQRVGYGLRFPADLQLELEEKEREVAELEERVRSLLPRFRRAGNPYFVGREDELVQLTEMLAGEEPVAISAIAGMGGIGKTELAVQYARRYGDRYPGGVLWIEARDRSLPEAVLRFFLPYVGELPTQDAVGRSLSTADQAQWCWRQWDWGEGLALVVFDDVTTGREFELGLPDGAQARVLLTTRERGLHSRVRELRLDTLPPDKAIALLVQIVGSSRAIDEEAIAQIADELGYLPLALELAGNYLLRQTARYTWARLLAQLREKGLAAMPMVGDSGKEERGVAAALTLSWEALSPESQRLGMVLGLFAPSAIAWELLERVVSELGWQEEAVLEAEQPLSALHLLGTECVAEGELPAYQLHPLVWRFFGDRLAESAEAERAEYERAFVTVMVAIAHQIPQDPTQEAIAVLSGSVPHLAAVVNRYLAAVPDEELIWPFVGLGRFYEGQGAYADAEPWYEQCVQVTRDRLGEEHPDVASSLNNLAELYKSQGRYEAAEPLYLEALEMRKRLLGEEHPDVASSLNNLAGLYDSQGRYEAAEPLYLEALEICDRILGPQHPSTILYRNNLRIMRDRQKSVLPRSWYGKLFVIAISIPIAVLVLPIALLWQLLATLARSTVKLYVRLFSRR